MVRLLFSIFFALGFVFSSLAQDPMQSGFDFLEKGDFAEAEAFFTRYSDANPENRTAKLCLGRAKGLLGKSNESKRLFDELLEKYPGDYEIRLNIAEWYMWNNSFLLAKDEYFQLVKENGNSFPALLGLANSLSQTEEYKNALTVVNRALIVQPKNSNAEISKKYILLGLGNKQRREKFYAQSHNSYKKILKLFPDDYDALLAQSETFLMQDNPEASRSSFMKMNRLFPYDENVLSGLSYVNILLQRKRASLKYAKIAIDTVVSKRTNIAYINALGVNRKFTKGYNYIGQIGTNDIDYQIAKARLLFWDKEYKESQTLFENLLHIDSSNTELKINYGELLLGTYQRDLAITHFEEAKVLLGFGPDLDRLLYKIKLEDRPFIEGNAFRQSDNGENSALDASLKVDLGRRKKLRPFILANYRKTNFDIDAINTSNYALGVGADFRIKPWLSIHATVLPFFYKNGDTEQKQLLTYTLGAKTSFFKYHNLDFTALRQKHNYNVALSESDLSYQEYRFDYNFFHPTGFGFFAQASYQSISDNNSRRLFYLSPYFQVRSAPNVKFGMSYLQMQFSNQETILYFSPSDFKSYEAFISISNLNNHRAHFLYTALVGLGFQTIDTNPSQNTRRIEVDLGYRFDWNNQVFLYFRNNNSAQSTIAGFSSETFGVRFRKSL